MHWGLGWQGGREYGQGWADWVTNSEDMVGRTCLLNTRNRESDRGIIDVYWTSDSGKCTKVGKRRKYLLF